VGQWSYSSTNPDLGTRWRSERCGVKKNLLPLPEIEPRLSSTYPVDIPTELFRLCLLIEEKSVSVKINDKPVNTIRFTRCFVKYKCKEYDFLGVPHCNSITDGFSGEHTISILRNVG
jgi:hypothetical protein